MTNKENNQFKKNVVGGQLVEMVLEQITQQAEEYVKKACHSVDESVAVMEEKLAQVNSLLCSTPTIINTGTIEVPEYKEVHYCFNIVTKILSSRKRKEKNIMLTGPAGAGKSYLGELLANAMKLPFHPMSVGIQTTKSDLLGFVNAMGTYVTSPVREAFEKGGILLLDEFDAANAGVVTILNGLLANNVVSFPDKVVTKNPDFICLCACNTFGRGADLEYVGRNRLDAATLDRFITVYMGYDNNLEEKLTNNKKWLEIVRIMRNNAIDNGIKHIISPRAAMDGADLLDGGFNIHDVLELCIFKGVEENTKHTLLKGITLPEKPVVNAFGLEAEVVKKPTNEIEDFVVEDVNGADNPNKPNLSTNDLDLIKKLTSLIDK